MRRLTLDASVVCKWYLDPAVEADIEAAQAIAVALDDPERILITADRRYFNAARHFGHVAMQGHDTSP